MMFNELDPNSATPQGIPVDFPGFQQVRANFDSQVSRKLGVRQLEWLYTIPFQLSFPVGGGDDVQIDIKRDAHFECYFITGDFTTLTAAGVDDGVCRTSIRITDGSNDLRLMDAFVPTNLFLSPGRQLSPGVAGNPSQQLFYPFPFCHIFPANGSIVIEGQNSGGLNVVNGLFWGKKLRASLDNPTAGQGQIHP